MPFIVVGGAAAVIHGAPITTQNLDIVPRQQPDDLTRLHAVLESLDARFRPVRADRDLQGQLNLATRHGPLDILCRLHDGRDHDALLPRSREIVDGELRVRVIDLDALIEIKSSTGRVRDQIVLPILLALRGQQGD